MTMKSYRYKALDSQKGTLGKGVLYAENLDHLRKILCDQNKELLKARRCWGVFPFRKSPSLREILEFFLQWHCLLKAKLPVVESLETLQDILKASLLHDAIENILIQLKGGGSLSQSFERVSHVFPPLIMHLLRMGEEAGNLEDSLEYLITHLKRQQKTRDKTLKALLYPLCLCVVLGGSLSILISFLLPQISGLCVALNTELPWMTQTLVMASEHFGTLTGFLALGSLGGSSTVILAMVFYPSLRRALSCKLLQIPLLGPLLQVLFLSQFFEVLWVLTKSRVGLLKSMGVAKGSLKNPFLQDQWSQIQMHIKNGQKLSELLKDAWYISPFVFRMIRMGEHTGDLTLAFEHVLAFYEREVDLKTHSLLRLLEPMLLLFFGGVFLILVLGIFYPLYNSISLLEG